MCRVCAQKEQGFEFFTASDMEGRTDRIFFVLDGAEEEYAKCKGLNTVMFDTSFGTNSFGMPLGCFTTVSETGQTVILAVSLLRSEKEYMFQWAFEKFHEAFRVRPGSFFTDGDLSMIKALKNLCAPGGIWALAACAGGVRVLRA